MAYFTSPWDLSAITPRSVAAELQEIEQRTAEIEKDKSALTLQISPAKFLSLVKKMEELRTLSAKLSCYAELRCAENSADQQASADRSKVETALTEARHSSSSAEDS